MRFVWCRGLKESNQHPFRAYLEELEVTVTEAAHTQVWAGWRNDGFVPVFNRMYYIREGSGVITIGGREYRPAAGQVIVMPAGVRQSYRTDPDHPYRKYWCHFTAVVGAGGLWDALALPFLVGAPDALYLESLFRRLIACHHGADISAAVRAKAAMLEILAYFLDTVAKSEGGVVQTGNARLGEILSFIDDHLDRDLTVSELAQRLHLHPNYFIRYFKSATGSSPIQYILRRRMEVAKQGLLDSGESISEVAAAVGLELHYFSRRFKAYTGYSPTEFRRLSAGSDVGSGQS